MGEASSKKTRLARAGIADVFIKSYVEHHPFAEAENKPVA